MAFVKLDCGILRSTIWFDREARELFLTALLMAVPRTITEPMSEIEVDSLALTGFVVPPGNYGFVEAAGVGIIRMAGIDDVQAGIEALKRLASPENTSRSPEFDGRRLVRVDGGYIVLNFAKYRERDHTAAERQKRYRDRQAEALRVTGETLRVTDDGNVTRDRKVTQAEAEAEGERENTFSPADLIEIWNLHSGSLPKASLTSKRARFALARISGCSDPLRWTSAVQRLARSHFANGSKGWRASIDFLLHPDSLTKIEEGQYDNPVSPNGSKPTGTIDRAFLEKNAQHEAAIPKPEPTDKTTEEEPNEPY